MCLPPLISIHAPHEGERQPTQSYHVRQCPDFNPRSPRGGATHIPCTDVGIYANFNPRSPRGGATIAVYKPFAVHIKFQSTLPTRGSDTDKERQLIAIDEISIHAPHEGERQRKSAFVCSISANLLNIIHCGTVTRAVSRRRIALFRLFSVRRSDVFMYAYASH